MCVWLTYQSVCKYRGFEISSFTWWSSVKFPGQGNIYAGVLNEDLGVPRVFPVKYITFLIDT